MNLYQLDSKQQDKDFLDYQPVRCAFTIPLIAIESVSEGQSIVIQLSNRKKYKGRIQKAQFVVRQNTVEGFLEILRQ